MGQRRQGFELLLLRFAVTANPVKVQGMVFDVKFQ